MLDYYYEFRGWDRETGVPRREKLEELGLEYVAKELKNLGLLKEESHEEK
jgi:aldehyde:ferredoxin oxidoreductase